MSANLYAWEPRIHLNPRDHDFDARVNGYSDPSHQQPPSPVLRAFVAALLARYPDLTKTEDTPWSDGPLIGDANGGFINLSVEFSWFDKARPFFLATARRFGLDAYDPQDDKYFPANGPATAWLALGLMSVGATAAPSRRQLLAWPLLAALV